MNRCQQRRWFYSPWYCRVRGGFISTIPGAAWLSRGVSLVCLGVIVAETMQRVSGLLAKMEAGGAGIFNAAQITAWVSQTADDSSGTAMTLATLLLVACWLMAVVDTYRLGSRQPAGTPGPKKG